MMDKVRKKEMAAKLQQAHQLLGSRQYDQCRQLTELMAAEKDCDVEQQCALGQLFCLLGDYMRAIAVYMRALEADQQNLNVLTGLAAAYISSEQYSHAGALLEKALQIDPDFVPAIAGMGAVMLQLKRYDEAIEQLEKAASRKSMDVTVYSNLALALGLQGRNEESLAYADKARRRDPKNPLVLSTLARTLVALGRMDEAKRFLLKAIESDPLYGMAYERLAIAKKFTLEDLPFIEKAESQLKNGMRVLDRYSLQFALGKMYDDIGHYDKAFQHYRQGNTLARAVEKPDGDAHITRFQKKMLTPDRLAKAGEFGNVSDVPIFIVGMPRSGTSLMEQIIDSHPLAIGAGELTEIPLRVDAIYGSAHRPSRFGMDRFVMPAPDFWRGQAEEYLRVLRTGREDAVRVVDKLPDNYRFLGLIAMMFPNARIIHAVRHPLDVCTSCYFQLFLGLKWSFDLRWIAETYCNYRQLMEHWKSVLPPGRIVDMNYEQLIEDPENQSRKLIDACGLPWDPACLEYATNTRGVQTASAWQVRQPIYKTSRMRWVKYAPYIGELAQGVVDYLDEADIEILAQHGVKIARRKRWS
jgi:tetratricopeptide (TPR) repeat protein